MEHVNDWCFCDIYNGNLWEEDLDVYAVYKMENESRLLFLL